MNQPINVAQALRALIDTIDAERGEVDEYLIVDDILDRLPRLAEQLDAERPMSWLSPDHRLLETCPGCGQSGLSAVGLDKCVMSRPVTVPSTPTLAEQAAALLARLGTTAKDIAAALEKASITGRPEDCETCPIAVYLMRSDLGLSDALVSEHHIALYVGGTRVDQIRTSEPVRQFIDRFDRGGYPRLVKAGAR